MSQIIDMNNVNSVSFNNNAVNEINLNNTKIWPLTTTVYGVKIDLANSDPETSVTYTDNAVGFSKSYMDFANDTFVWGSWQDKWPFNQVKPCLFKNGAVVKYLNPNNYAQDTDGNSVDITGPDGDVMIEIPKIYYKLSKDANYQYIQISNTAQTGFCCLAHTYKGVEKNKVYIGAYQSYNDNTKSKSISGVSATGNISLNTWRTYARNQGSGYENFYWDLLILLQCLYVIQFKNLNSQSALGRGSFGQSDYSISGGLNTKGLYYGTSTRGQMKFLGIEDFYGGRSQLIDGAYTLSTRNLATIDSTDPTVDYNGSGTGYTDRGYTLSRTLGGYTTAIMGSNCGGFVPTSNQGSATTYYCDRGHITTNTGCVPDFGGYNNIANNGYGGAFYLTFTNNADNASDTRCGRLAFC